MPGFQRRLVIDQSPLFFFRSLGCPLGRPTIYTPTLAPRCKTVNDDLGTRFVDILIRLVALDGRAQSVASAFPWVRGKGCVTQPRAITFARDETAMKEGREGSVWSGSYSRFCQLPASRTGA